MYNAGAYGASKAAVAMLTRVPGFEFCERGMDVTAISPGEVATEKLHAHYDNCAKALGINMDEFDESRKSPVPTSPRHE